MEILGRMVNASNSTLVVNDNGSKFIYKPISGERPLWDFAAGTLAYRERAAYVLSHIGGWHVVPETTLREGPLGRGSFQAWVDAEVVDVEVVAPGEVTSEWIAILNGVDENGNVVTLAHANKPELRAIALFDAVANNADRKGGHLLTDAHGKVHAIDHGVTFHQEPKLRTVLWGFVDQELTDSEIEQLKKVREIVRKSELVELLSQDEIAALVVRIDELLFQRVFPAPSGNWPSVPWPVF